MGYIGGKISGHSGTQFKHRKSSLFRSKFKDQNSHIKLVGSSSKPQSIPEAGQSIYLKSKPKTKIDKYVYSLTIIIFLAIGFFMFNNAMKYYYSWDDMPYKNESNEITKTNNYVSQTLKTANLYLKNNKYELALSEFIKLYTINPTNQKAVWGIIVCMENLCVTDSYYCDKIIPYNKYLISLNPTYAGKIKVLQKG